MHGESAKGKRGCYRRPRARKQWPDMGGSDGTAEVGKFEAYFGDKRVVLHEGVNVTAEGTGNRD